MNDKIKHLIAGFLISGLTGFFLQGLIVFIPALLAGLAKEFIWDKWMKRGTFEWKDIAFTCWGGLLATFLWYFLEWVNIDNIRLLLVAFLIICFEAVSEGLIKRFSPAVSAIIFKWWVQWLIAGGLFALWLFYALQSDFILWRLITGFVLFRFFIFDNVFNLSAKLPFDYIGSRKVYDMTLGWIRDMWGFSTVVFLKCIAGFWGVMWLIGK